MHPLSVCLKRGNFSHHRDTQYAVAYLLDCGSNIQWDNSVLCVRSWKPYMTQHLDQPFPELCMCDCLFFLNEISHFYSFIPSNSWGGFFLRICARACIWHLSGGLRVMPWSRHKLGHCIMNAVRYPVWESASLCVSFRAMGNHGTAGFISLNYFFSPITKKHLTWKNELVELVDYIFLSSPVLNRSARAVIEMVRNNFRRKICLKKNAKIICYYCSCFIVEKLC